MTEDDVNQVPARYTQRPAFIRVLIMKSPPLTQSVAAGNRRFCCARCLSLVLLASSLALVSGAELPGTASARISDVMLARAALAALDQVEELRGVHLVVSVVDGLAVIGGPVPSVRHSQRAEEVVRAVPGIRDVRNTCFVSSGPDPLLRAVADKNWREQRPAKADIPGVWGQPGPPVSPFPLNGVARTDDRTKTVIVRRPAEALPGGGEVLGAPVSPYQPSPLPTRDVPATAPGTLTAAARDNVLTAARLIQQSDPRFARLHIELRDHALWISGEVQQPEDAWELAARLRQIAGVDRVVVGTVVRKMRQP